MRHLCGTDSMHFGAVGLVRPYWGVQKGLKNACLRLINQKCGSSLSNTCKPPCYQSRYMSSFPAGSLQIGDG